MNAHMIAASVAMVVASVQMVARIQAMGSSSMGGWASVSWHMEEPGRIPRKA